MRSLLVSIGLAIAVGAASPAFAGSIFVSGHDSDFHAALGGNAVGARNLINRSLDFARDTSTAPILFLQSNTNNIALGDHTNSENGLTASGWTAGATPGQHYVKVDATTFASANLSQYSALFIPSDHGGTLTNADVAALNARSADIIAYLNAGGGLVAWAEDGFRSGGAGAGFFGFLPFLVTSTAVSESETGNTLTPFGASLGLVTSDINGNFSHNFFTATGGMNVVDVNSEGQILSLAFRGSIGVGGVVPEPTALTLLASGLVGLLGAAWRASRRT